MGAPPGNLVVCRPSGTGRTFLLQALGQQAVEAGLNVAWFTWTRSACWSTATAPTTPSPRRSPASCADIVAVDDIGLLSVGTDVAGGLYRLVDAAYY
jgi:chromosomal replication initiation ATPase DnaA